MLGESQISYRELNREDCNENLLRDFNRFQEVNRCWRNENGAWVLKDVRLIEQWDNAGKDNKISAFIWNIEHGGVTVGAFVEGRLVGFATVDSERFGSENQYVQLCMFHVSYENRNKGIGKKLFALSCAKAKQMGVRKLYISAHSSEESQAFYKSVGCIFAEEVNQMLAEEEPFTCQMEYVL